MPTSQVRPVDRAGRRYSRTPDVAAVHQQSAQAVVKCVGGTQFPRQTARVRLPGVAPFPRAARVYRQVHEKLANL